MTGWRATNADSPACLDRRSFITIAVAMTGTLAGCSGETKETTPNQDEAADAPEGSGTPDAIARVDGKIELVYDRIEDVPLVADGEFVYDLESSVESVDYEEMVEIAKDALRAAEDVGQDVDVPRRTREYLQRAAKIAFLLVDQRFLVHKALLGGLVFRRAFSEGEYERAVKVIDESRTFLERLRNNGSELEKEAAAYEGSDHSLVTLDDSSITSDLAVLKEVLGWLVPVFEGFAYSATGMVVVQEGNQELQEERYGSAQGRYDEAREHFSRAETAFNSAHGRGESLEYLVPLVNDLRCFVPTLVSGYDDLEEAFTELESGNEEKGLEIADETMSKMNNEFSRCF